VIPYKTYGFGSGGVLNLTKLDDGEVRKVLGLDQSGKRPYMWKHILHKCKWPTDLFTNVALELKSLSDDHNHSVVDVKEFGRWARRIEQYGVDGVMFEYFLSHVADHKFWNCEFELPFSRKRADSWFDEAPLPWLISRCVAVGTTEVMRLRLEATLFFDGDVLKRGEKVEIGGVTTYLIEEDANPFGDRRRGKPERAVFPVMRHCLILSLDDLNIAHSGVAAMVAASKGWKVGFHATLNRLAQVYGLEDFPLEVPHAFAYSGARYVFNGISMSAGAIEMVRGMVNLVFAHRQATKKKSAWVGCMKVIFNEYETLERGVPKDVCMIDILRRAIKMFGLKQWMIQAFRSIRIDYRLDQARDMQIYLGLCCIANYFCCFTRVGRGFTGVSLRLTNGVTYLCNETRALGLMRTLTPSPTLSWYDNYTSFLGIEPLRNEMQDTFSELEVSGETFRIKANVLFPQ